MRATRMLTVVSLLALVACDLPMEGDELAEDEPPIGQERQALGPNDGLSFNGLSFNGLSFNGLSFNSLTQAALLKYPLNEYTIESRTLYVDGRTIRYYHADHPRQILADDPEARKFLEYVWQCAMPTSASLDYNAGGVEYGPIKGQFDLAPEWASGGCDETCQRWISACLIARVNHEGERVLISVVKSPYYGDTSSSNPINYRTSMEEKVFGTPEGAYFGNVFKRDSSDEPSPKVYGCAMETGGMFTQVDLETRLCGDSLAGCEVDRIINSCPRTDTSSLDQYMCKSWNSNGSFHRCYSGGVKEEWYYDSSRGMFRTRWRTSGTRYDEVISVYRAEDCPHADVATGGPMPRSCSSCSRIVGDRDSYCRYTAWDGLCVQQAKDYCGSHSVHSSGSALAPETSSCTAIVCLADSYCCTNYWDSICVGEANEMCK